MDVISNIFNWTVLGKFRIAFLALKNLHLAFYEFLMRHVCPLSNETKNYSVCCEARMNALFFLFFQELNRS
jgi:hypothetical protein